MDFYNIGEAAGDPGLSTFKGKWPFFPIWFGSELVLSFRRSSGQDINTIKMLMQNESIYGTEIVFPTNYMDSSIKAGKVLLALNANDEIVGMLGCRSILGKKLMTNLITRSDYQYQGIGKKLLEQLSKEEGKFEFFCVKSNKKAIEFYSNIKEVSTYGDYIDERGIVDSTKIGYTYTSI